jgi:hypothetical protein
MERIINYNNGGIHIKIERPGIYAIGTDSAQGKSFMCSLISTMDPEGISVITYNKDTSETIRSIRKFAESSDQLLIIDRFNMIICDEVIDTIKQITDKYIVLDYKDVLYDTKLDSWPISLLWSKEGFCLYA